MIKWNCSIYIIILLHLVWMLCLNASVLSEYNKRKDWLSDKNSSIKQNTRKYQLQQKLAVNDADQSIIEAKKKTERKQTEKEVREEERKKGIVNFKN